MNEQETRRTSTVCVVTSCGHISWTKNGYNEKNGCDYILNTVVKENRPNNACELILKVILLVLFLFSDSSRYHLTMQRFMTYVSVISFLYLSFICLPVER